MKLKHYIFTFLALFVSTNVFAYNAEIDGIYYNFSENEATVTYKTTGYNSYSGAVVIPESVFYSGKTYNVTSIGKRAFYACRNLTSIIISNSVTSFGQEAFYGCTSLTSVIIPNSVTSIGQRAFGDCNLTSITIPDSVTNIGKFAFSNCYSLNSITIGNSVTSIGSSAFYNCSSLTSVTIGNNVTSIGESAFENCNSLSSVIIPEGVTTIGNNSFSGCNRLETIYLPTSITSIGYCAFADKSNYKIAYPCLQFLRDIYCKSTNLPLTNSRQLYYTIATGGWSETKVYYDANIFGEIKPNNVILHVPSKAISDYNEMVPWNSCINIVPLDHIIKYIVDGEVYKCDTLFYLSEIHPVALPTKDGYTFSGWTEIPETMPDHDIMVYGYFIFDPDGIGDVKALESVTEIARYDLLGRKRIKFQNSKSSIEKRVKQVNIIQYKDGTKKKVLIK